MYSGMQLPLQQIFSLNVNPCVDFRVFGVFFIEFIILL